MLGKLFDIIVLEEQHHSLITDELQFGFKKNASTVLCTSLLMETVEYYNDNDTDYLLLRDASKAFDRVEYVKLFTILRDRKICPIVLRLLTQYDPGGGGFKSLRFFALTHLIL